MLKTNIDIKRGLCNGSRGVILGYQPFKAWMTHMHKEDLKYRYPGAEGKLKKWGEKHPQLPFVLFANGLKMTIPPATWERKFEAGKLSVTRLQIPLIPAWALTIHKSQGMSLDRVHINLRSAFGSGMSYVALSRARNLEGLQLEGFKREGVKASPKVIEYYRNIDRAPDNGGSPSRQEGGSGSAGDSSAPAKPKRGWTMHLEEQVKDVVRQNFQSAVTQVLGSGGQQSDLQRCSDAFKAAVAGTLDEVLNELRTNMRAAGLLKEEKESCKPASPPPAKRAPPQPERERPAPEARGPPPPQQQQLEKIQASKMSAGQLKRLLVDKGVNLKGCLEKEDLVKKAKETGVIVLDSDSDSEDQPTQNYQ